MNAAQSPDVRCLKIALAIPHARHRPDRVTSLARLLEQLGLEGEGNGRMFDGLRVTHRVFGEREHYTAWSKRMWDWLEASGADYGLQLQDDTLVAPNFWPALRAMLTGVPDELICLESAHPAAPLYHLEDRPWFTTADMLIGTAYVGPRHVYREFRAWRERRLREGALGAITEDTLFGIFCLVTGRKIWCPTRTIVDHDMGTPSTCGNDAHPNRRPRVRWDNAGIPAETFESSDYWTPEPRVPHVGRGYGLTPQVAMQWVTGLTPDDFARMMNDDGRLEVKRAQATAKTLMPREQIPRVVLATPTRGSCSAKYMASVVATIHDGAVELVQPWDHAHWWLWSDDIVRVRSRMVREFLRSGATHLWFVDDDVSFDPLLLQRMIAVERDFVAVPYPSKHIDWTAVANDDGRSPEARGLKYDNVQPLPARAREPNDLDASLCLEVARVGFGCVLLTRAGLQRLIDHVSLTSVDPNTLTALEGRDRLLFHDQGKPTWALFAQRFTPRLESDGRVVVDLLSEDLAFCDRWRDSGQKIWLYLGPGSPASHTGEYTFRGLTESFRGPAPMRAPHAPPLPSPGDAALVEPPQPPEAAGKPADAPPMPG